MNRAYSLLTVKSVDNEQRKLTGIATTPEPDRQGDIVEPSGVTFKNPLPLLLHHDHQRPVGKVKFLKATSAGIPFEATLPSLDEPGTVKDRVDEAWHSVKSGLIAGVSIGFRVLNDAVEPLKSGGLRFLATEVVELSLVTIPANASATILTVKSLDKADSALGVQGGISRAEADDLIAQIGALRADIATSISKAALGHNTPGDSGTVNPTARKDAQPMTVAEQIEQFQNTRNVKSAKMIGLMTKAAETGTTLDQAQTEEYDGLSVEVKAIDNHLTRLRDMEKALASTATPAAGGNSTDAAASRGGVLTQNGVPVVQVKSQLPKGTGFTRMAMAIAATNGNKWEAAEYAKRWESTTPEVSMVLKSAIAAGTTTDSTFAAPLAVAQPLMSEFIELLRPKTLLGRIPNLRRVPFNVSVPAQTAGGTYGWVGQGKPKPLTNMATATVTLTINKIAGIIVLTEELVRISSPSAEELVRNEMIAGIVKFMDEQFIDPSIAASGTVSPASITNGTTAVTSAGTSNDNALTDLKALVSAFVTANLSLENAVWIMSEGNAFALSTAVNALGAPLFPSMSNGTLFGRPVVATQSAGTTVALVDAQGILVADDGGVNIDVSREATLQMDSAPTDPVDASTVMVSMFQQNLVALRAERFVTWKRARTASVKYVAQTYV